MLIPSKFKIVGVKKMLYSKFEVFKTIQYKCACKSIRFNSLTPTSLVPSDTVVLF